MYIYVYILGKGRMSLGNKVYKVPCIITIVAFPPYICILVHLYCTVYTLHDTSPFILHTPNILFNILFTCKGDYELIYDGMSL